MIDTKTHSTTKHIVLVPCYLRPIRKTPIVVPSGERLSTFLALGRTYHPLCRQAFVAQVIRGYYAYERRIEYRTCALAAAYAGAFGPLSIERPEFSYTMAIWQLSRRVGFALEQTVVVGPTGRKQNLAKEMIDLIDTNYWTRHGVAEWLRSIGY